MTSICGKCGGKIPAGVENCPECNPAHRSNEGVPMVMVLAVVCTSFVLLGTSVVNVKTAPPSKSSEVGDLNRAAYDAARQYIVQQRPHIQNLSEYMQSGIEHTGRVFSVSISSDELSTNQQPVRNFYRVDMEFADGKWTLKSIQQ